MKGGAAPSIPGEYLRQGDEAVLESAAAQDTGDLPNSDVRKLDTVQGDLEMCFKTSILARVLG